MPGPTSDAPLRPGLDGLHDLGTLLYADAHARAAAYPHDDERGLTALRYLASAGMLVQATEGLIEQQRWIRDVGSMVDEALALHDANAARPVPDLRLDIPQLANILPMRPLRRRVERDEHGNIQAIIDEPTEPPER